MIDEKLKTVRLHLESWENKMKLGFPRMNIEVNAHSPDDYDN